MSCNLFWTETGGWAENHNAVTASLFILAAFSQKVVLNSSLVQQQNLTIISKQAWISLCIFPYLYLFLYFNAFEAMAVFICDGTKTIISVQQ